MAGQYLQRNPTSTGNRSVFTWSGWVKHNKLNTVASNNIWYVASAGNSEFRIFITQTGDLIVTDYIPSPQGVAFQFQTERLLRDHGNWFHLLVSVDTTKDNGADRVKIYVNGVSITEFSSTTYGNQNHQTRMNMPGEVNYLGQNTIGGGSYQGFFELFDVFSVDGQALTPDVFGFYKDGDGYQSSGTTQATDFRPGQWSPRAPKSIKYTINRSGGFGVNGFYLPMNDSSNPGADFHCAPNSIIKLKGEDLPQPQNGAPATSDAYVSQLRSDPFAANLVLAIPGITGGQGSGYGDYSADIKGSGSNKTITSPTPSAVFSFSSYYGSALIFDVFDGNNLSTPNNSDFNFSGGEDFTVELWCYRQKDDTTESLIGVFENSSARRAWQMETRVNAGLRFQWWSDGSSGTSITTADNVVPKDQWNHICAERSGDTITLYVNGVPVGVDTTAGSIYSNTTDPLRIGMLNAAEDQMLTGRLQDVRVYKGVAKYKGGFDVLKPYTPVGIESWRTTDDTCKNNFATLNPLFSHSSSNTYTNGNLKAVATANDQVTTGNMAFSSGKWYWETRIFNDEMIGLGIPGYIGGYPGQNSNAFSYHKGGGVYYGATGPISYGAGWTSTTYQVIGLAVDWTNRRAYWSVDGVWANSADPSAGTGFYNITISAPNVAASVDALPAWRTRSANASEQVSVNFGQNPSFGGELTAGTFTDDSGKGLFKYAPPTGFLALCEDNLPTPAIADPGKHFKTVLYDGALTTGSGKLVTGVGFQPDFIWIKNRSRSGTSGDGFSDHALFDSVRGYDSFLSANTTAAENTNTPANRLAGVSEDGFSVGYFYVTGYNGDNYVAWCWKAGGAAVSNTDGSITSQVSANQTAGFSIVTYTGNGTTGSTVGHGLGKTPAFIIIKQRNGTNNWPVWTKALPEGDNGTKPYGYLDLTNGWNISTPGDIFSTNANANTNSVFYIGSNSLSNNNTDTYIAYCWAEIEGFSKFGSYVGNGNADGPFVYCGFKPAWVLIKKTDGSGTENWRLFDSSRCPTNQNNKHLLPSSANGESTESGIDLVSNGFKLRHADAHQNQSGTTYVFMAFAESPFQTSNAK